RADVHLVWNARRDRPRPAGTELARLVADTEHERSRDADPELLVRVLMLGDVTVRVELDHAERDPLAVHDASVHAVPDALQVERGELVEGAHGLSLAVEQSVPHPPHVDDERSGSHAR